MKKHPLYRQIHCHLGSACPEDTWQENDSHFVVFPLHAQCGGLAYVGFAVNRQTLTVSHSRLLIRENAGLPCSSRAGTNGSCRPKA